MKNKADVDPIAAIIKDRSKRLKKLSQSLKRYCADRNAASAMNSILKIKDEIDQIMLVTQQAILRFESEAIKAASQTASQAAAKATTQRASEKAKAPKEN